MVTHNKPPTDRSIKAVLSIVV